jgi:hypothetical protein
MMQHMHMILVVDTQRALFPPLALLRYLQEERYTTEVQTAPACLAASGVPDLHARTRRLVTSACHKQTVDAH